MSHQLERLYEDVKRPQITFPEQDAVLAVVEEGRQLKTAIDTMLREDKVSLPAMRELLAKIELVPVDFEAEVSKFQQKMLSAQNWLAKVRKCMPKRRQTRRRIAGGGNSNGSGNGDSDGTKKMDLDMIRALVDDAPCEDSTEMFEMQDLLDCADEWAEKVRQAIDANAADVTLEYLKELVAEGADIPVEMDERNYLEAEVAAREWCTTATEMLADRRPIADMEELLERAKEIRQQVHPRKQSRWKPQVERDINAAMDLARRWIHETRDALGSAAFDKRFASSSSSKAETTDQKNDAAKKKSIDVIKKLIEKADGLAIDVSSFTKVLSEWVDSGEATRADARAILVSIGYLPAASTGDDSKAFTVRGNDITDVVKSESSSTDQPDAPSNASAPSAPSDSNPTPFVEAAATTRAQARTTFAHAVSVLERVESFPFAFDEGETLGRIINSEKQWAQRVRECVPPRQSRKKRQANQPFAESDLRQLFDESRTLYFAFPDELRIASKELEDLSAWRGKVSATLDTRVAEEIASVIEQLEKIDVDVHEKVQAARRKLQVDNGRLPSVESTGKDVKLEDARATSEAGAGVTADVEMADANDGSAVLKPEESASMTSVGSTSQTGLSSDDTSSADALGVYSEMLMAMKSARPAQIDSALNVRAIMAHVRLESGSMQKNTKEGDDESGYKQEDGNDKSGPPAARDMSMLQSVLDMVETSLDAVNCLELKEEERKTVEEMVVSGDKDSDKVSDKGDVKMGEQESETSASGATTATISSTDEAVQVLDTWRDQLRQALDDSDLLSVVPPEQQALSLVIDLLDWLEGARSIFYMEPLPLSELVERGKELQRQVAELDDSTLQPVTLSTLQRMLWPLPYLQAHERVVAAWNDRVQTALKRKHVRVSDMQSLLDDGNALLLEKSDFKQLLDEAKRAKMWLLKVKKRARALAAKQQARMTLAAARALVEEGEELALELPTFDFLKEHFDAAVDWENRVLASGLESGQARIANLLALLNEYDCARLVIDLDMHREVLASATERFCICRQPFDGLMIGCDFCDDWFHDNCIGMSKEKAEKVEHYTCPSCCILQELKALLEKTKSEHEARTRRAQEEGGKDSEHEENLRVFDKQRAAALRKIKREERAIERNEMLLFSASNHLTQLRTRIGEIEHATASISRGHAVENGDRESAQQLSALAQMIAPPEATSTPSAGAAAVSASIASSSSDPAGNARGVPNGVEEATTTGASLPSSAEPAAAVSSQVQAAADVMPPLPNILLPRSGVLSLKNDKGATASSSATTAAGECNDGSAASASTTASAASSASDAASDCTAGTTDTTNDQDAKVDSADARGQTSAAENGAAKPLAQLLGPIFATMPDDTTQRLSALVAAGDVEQQLVTMKSEQVELKKQVTALQDSLGLSRARREVAQKALADATSAFNARRDQWPAARTWIHNTVALLNSTSLVTRSRLDDGETESTSGDYQARYLIPQYADAISEATGNAGSTADASHDNASTRLTSLAALFPDVKQYERVLRAVCWSVVVVAKLQERPSHDALSDAIAYAVRYDLWDGIKTITPLRSVLARVDAWVARTHKCVAKPSSRSSSSQQQRLGRIKQLMNEYSKLPLTWQAVALPIEEYVALLDRSLSSSSPSSAPSEEQVNAAERAAIRALEDGMRSVSSSSNGTSVSAGASALASLAAGGESAAAANAQKPPRKRKAYTRKDKAGGSTAGASTSSASSASVPARKRARSKKAAASPSADGDVDMTEQR